MSQKHHHRLKTVSLVILITLMGKVLGLVRNMLLGQTFGTGFEADALLAASHLPRWLFDAVFASAVSASFIPVFTETLEHEGREEADRLAGSFFTIVGLTAALLTALGMVFAPQLVGLMTTFTAAQTAALATRLLTTIFPSLFFTGVAFSMVGVLNALGQFKMPAAMSIASNGILIVYFFFFVQRFGVYGAAVAMLLGWIAQAVMQMPSLRKHGFRYRPSLRHPGLKKIGKLMLPVMISTWILPINMAVSIRFASSISGGTAGLTLANDLYIMIAGIFVLSVTNVLFPEMSRLSATGDKTAFRDMVRDTMQTLLFLLIPMTVGLMLMATPLVQLLYQYQEFDVASTALTSSALAFISLGMVGYGIQNVLVRAFYAEKRGRVPLVAGVISIGVNAVLCWLLVGSMGVAGLALASAVSLLTSALILVPAAHRMFGGGLVTGRLILSLGKMAAAAFCMAVVVFVTRELLQGFMAEGNVLMRIVLVGVPALIGAMVYFGLAHLFRLREVRSFLQTIKTRRKGDT